MADPTEAHQFTFGCYRAEDVTLADGGDATDATTDEPTDDADDRTVLADGGTLGATTCPSCEGDVANVQGVPACTHCTWNAH